MGKTGKEKTLKDFSGVDINSVLDSKASPASRRIYRETARRYHGEHL